MYQKKLEYMIQVNVQIRNASLALEVMTRKDKRMKPEGTFADAYNELNTLNISVNWERTLKGLKFNVLDGIPPGFTMFEPDFQFSNDPERFTVEFGGTLILFASAGENGDPRVDLLAMKALFAAGGMVAKLEREGYVRSDRPKKAGSSPSKGYIDEQVYFDLLYSEIEGKSRHDICNKIRKKALKREEERARKKGETPKKVLSIKIIGKRLKEDLDKYFK